MTCSSGSGPNTEPCSDGNKSGVGDGDDTGVESLDDLKTSAVTGSSEFSIDESCSDSVDIDQIEHMWQRTDWMACAAIVILSLLLVGLHTHAYRTLSPIDELQHIDYALKASKLDIVRVNERVGFEAMAEAACRSVDSPGYAGPACGLDTYDPNDFQERGFNTAATQYPIYYVITGLGARAMTWLGVVNSPVTGLRMMGALWSAAAFSVLWYVMGLLRIDRLKRAVVTALLMVTPIVLVGAATVNADASLLLGGAVTLLATLKFEERKLHPALLALTYIGVFFIEATNLLIVGACSAYLIARVAVQRDESITRRVTPAIVLAGIVVLRLEYSSRTREALFPRNTSVSEVMSSAPMFSKHETTGVSLSKMLEQLPSVFTPVINPLLTTPLRSQVTISFIQLTNWLLIALMFAAAFVVVGKIRAAWISRVGLAAMLLAGPFYTFYFAYFSGSDFPAPARFGLPLVALVVVAAASAITTRATMVLVACVAGGAALNTLYQLILF